MGDILKAMTAGQVPLQLGQDAVVELDDALAAAAQKVVMVVASGCFIGDLKASQAVAEVDSLDQPQALKKAEGTIHRGQVARLADGFGNFFGRGGAVEVEEGLEHGLAGAGDASSLTSETFHPLLARRWVVAFPVRRRLHRMRSVPALRLVKCIRPEI